MTWVRLTARQLRYEQRIFRRTPAAVFFTFAMPVLLLVIFASLSNRSSADGRDFVRHFVPGMAAFGLLSACYGNLAARFVYRREAGLLKRVRATPLPQSVLVAGFVANAVVVGTVLVAVVGVAGWALYDVPAPAHWATLLVTVAVGAAAACALGLAVAMFVPDVESADPIVFATLLPLLFISGAFVAVPNDSLLGRVSAVFPVRHVLLAAVDGYGFDRTAGSAAVHLAVVAAWGAVGAFVAVRRFRWAPCRR